MRDAKKDLLRLKSLKQSKSYACNVDFNWLVNTLRRYINGWVEGREIGMDEAKFLEVREIVEDIAARDNISADVKQEALRRIGEAREKLGVVTNDL